MHVLIVGGSYGNPGGLESFAEQSARALGALNLGWTFEWLPSESAFLRPKRLPVLLKQLGRLIAARRSSPDLVWLQYVNLPDLAFLLVAKLAGMRVMVTPHLGSDWASQRNPVLRRLSQLLLGAADRLALISWTQEQEIALPGGISRSLIRNFLPDYVVAGAPPESGSDPVLRIIHSARLSAEKGSFKVVEVSARLRDAGIAADTVITGGADPATYEKLAMLIAERGVGDRVHVLGRVPQDELVARLNAADVLLHLSTIDSYPLVVLEAIAFANLPVAIDLAGVRDMVESYDGHIVSREGAVNEATAWLATVDLADLRARARREAEKVRRDYAWERCARALDAALRATISRSAEQTIPQSTE